MSDIASDTPVWLDQLTRAERDALRPAVPSDLDRRPDVLVVGGGVQGLAAATACREEGLGRVVLIEREHLAAGPSGSAAGMLCPDAHLDTEGPAFVEFARASLERYEALAVEVGSRLRMRRLDWLVLRRIGATSLLAARPGVQRLDSGAVRRLVPALDGESPGLLVPGGLAHLNPLRLAAVLASRAGTVATGIEYLGLQVRGGRAVAVHTSHGDFQPGAVVLATGLAPPELMTLEQLRVKGHLIATGPAPITLPIAIAGPDAHVMQLEDGRLMTGGDHVPHDSLPGVDPAAVERFRAELRRLFPAQSSLRLTHAWSCARPATADRLPVIDRAPGLGNVWLSAGHYTTGLLLAPATGHAIASWIRSGAPHAAVAPFQIAGR